MTNLAKIPDTKLKNTKIRNNSLESAANKCGTFYSCLGIMIRKGQTLSLKKMYQFFYKSDKIYYIIKMIFITYRQNSNPNS